MSKLASNEHGVSDHGLGTTGVLQVEIKRSIMMIVQCNRRESTAIPSKIAIEIVFLSLSKLFRFTYDPAFHSSSDIAFIHLGYLAIFSRKHPLDLLVASATSFHTTTTVADNHEHRKANMDDTPFTAGETKLIVEILRRCDGQINVSLPTLQAFSY